MDKGIEVPFDERTVQGPTFAQDVEHAIAVAENYRSVCDQGFANQRAAARELSLAITALEEARMRFTRGYAQLSGGFSPVDLEALDMVREADRG